MALDQPIHRYAWAFDVMGADGTARFATTDLWREADITALGAFYPKRIKSPDSAVVHSMPNGFYGIDEPSRVTFVLDNSEWSGDCPVKSGLRVWLQGDRIRGVASGGAVTTWVDASGEGNDATINTGTVTYQPEAVNGHNVCRFNTSAGMTIQNLSLTGNYTVAIVYSFRNNNNQFRRAISSTTNNWLIGPYSNTYRAFNDAHLVGPATTQDAFVVHLFIGSSASFGDSRVNGTSVGTNTGTATPVQMCLGLGNPFSEPHDGDIAEVMAWNRRLSTIEAQAVEGFLGRRYSVTGPVYERIVDQDRDYRGTPCRLRHYDLETSEVVTELQGILVEAQFPGNDAIVTAGSHYDGVFDTLIPTQVVDVATTEFASAQDAGVPLPVIFGRSVPVRPVFIADDTVTQAPYGWDYIVGYDADIRIEDVFTDIDQDQAGLEPLSAWRDAPGTPTYSSTTKFTVTGDHSKAYGTVNPGGTVIGGMPLRCHTTATGTADYAYSVCGSYTGGTASGTVTVFDAILDAGLSGVQIAGDFNVIRNGYVNVEVNPATGATADFTAIRLYFPEQGGLIVIASNSDLTNPATVIAEILSDDVWGLSSVTPIGLDGASFLAAASDFTAAGLSTAVQGALGGDKSQRAARDVLNEILMMRGARLTYSATTEQFSLVVDTAPSASTLSFEEGPGTKNNIKRVNSYGYVPLSESVRNLTVAFESPNRSRSNLGRYVPGSYRQRATVAVSSRGKDRVITSPWIRTQSVAGRVCYFVAKKLKAADKPLSITVGQEGRQVTLGQLVRVKIPERGIDRDFQVMGITRSLIETTLTLHRSTPEAYTYDAAQVVFTAEPDAPSRRFTPGLGGNLIYNPTLGPPLVTSIVGAIEADAPEGLDIYGVNCTSWWVNYDRITQGNTLSDSYVQATWNPIVGSLFPYVEFRTLPLLATTDYIASIYSDASTGLYFRMVYWVRTSPATIGQRLYELTTVVDPTDTDSNGWVRHYARFRTDANYTYRAPTGLSVMRVYTNVAGTFNFAAPMIERVTTDSRRPSPWRGAPPKQVTTDQGTATGLSPERRKLIHTIPAGSIVVAVPISVAATVSHNYDVGTDGDPTAWANNCSKKTVGNRTTAADFADGGNPVHYPTATPVYIRTAGGGTATFTGGTVTASIDYLRPTQPTIT